MLVLVYSQIRQRAYLVRVLNESSDFQPASLSAIAKTKLKVGPYILLGHGEAEQGGAEKNSILCDIVESSGLRVVPNASRSSLAGVGCCGVSLLMIVVWSFTRW